MHSLNTPWHQAIGLKLRMSGLKPHIKVLCGLVMVWLVLPSCRKNVDNPLPDGQHGTVTTMALILNDSSAFPGRRDTFLFDDPDGAGGQQPLRWDTLRLHTSRRYATQILLTNKLANPPEDLNTLIQSQGAQHLFVFRSDSSLLNVQISDRDQLNLPLGLQSVWITGNRSDTGSLEINLRHIAFGKNINSGPGSGHSDIQIRFPLSIQP